MTTTTKRSRRRQLIINKPLQTRIIFKMCWPAAVGLAVCSALLGILCSRLSDEALAANVELESLVPLLLTVASFLVIAGLYMFASALQFSNKVAGPIYRMGKTMDAVMQGDLQARVKLRKDDVLMELQDGVNEFLGWLEEHPPAGLEGEPEAKSASGQAAVDADALDRLPSLVGMGSEDREASVGAVGQGNSEASGSREED